MGEPGAEVDGLALAHPVIVGRKGDREVAVVVEDGSWDGDGPTLRRAGVSRNQAGVDRVAEFEVHLLVGLFQPVGLHLHVNVPAQIPRHEGQRARTDGGVVRLCGGVAAAALSIVHGDLDPAGVAQADRVPQRGGRVRAMRVGVGLHHFRRPEDKVRLRVIVLDGDPGEQDPVASLNGLAGLGAELQAGGGKGPDVKALIGLVHRVRGGGYRKGEALIASPEHVLGVLVSLVVNIRLGVVVRSEPARLLTPELMAHYVDVKLHRLPSQEFPLQSEGDLGFGALLYRDVRQLRKYGRFIVQDDPARIDSVVRFSVAIQVG